MQAEKGLVGAPGGLGGAPCGPQVPQVVLCQKSDSSDSLGHWQPGGLSQPNYSSMQTSPPCQQQHLQERKHEKEEKDCRGFSESSATLVK